MISVHDTTRHDSTRLDQCPFVWFNIRWFVALFVHRRKRTAKHSDTYTHTYTRQNHTSCESETRSAIPITSLCWLFPLFLICYVWCSACVTLCGPIFFVLFNHFCLFVGCRFEFNFCLFRNKTLRPFICSMFFPDDSLAADAAGLCIVSTLSQRFVYQFHIIHFFGLAETVVIYCHLAYNKVIRHLFR